MTRAGTKEPLGRTCARHSVLSGGCLEVVNHFVFKFVFGKWESDGPLECVQGLGTSALLWSCP